SRLIRRYCAAGPGIDRTLGTVRRRAGAGDLGLDRGARAEAGIDEAHRLEPVERGAIVVEVLGLPAHRAVPIESKPGEALEDRDDEFLAAAGGIDVLDAQEEAPARRARRAPAHERRMRVAEMEAAGGARREARDEAQGASLPRKGTLSRLRERAG